MIDHKGSIFDKALKQILIFEGGYVNHKNDLGGATNFGIIQTTYDSYRLSKQLKKQSVRYITDEEVADIYYNRYWLACGCDQMPSKLAVFVFDTAVNMGISKIVSYMQEIVFTKQTQFNSKMLNDIRFFINKRGEDELLRLLILRRKASYKAFAKKGNQVVFLQGWLNRVQHLEDYLKELA